MKSLLITPFLLLFVLISSAQSTIIDDLMEDFERGKKMSIAYLEAMPADKMNYRPAEGTRTFAEQMLHAAQGMIGLTANGTSADKIYNGQNLEKDPQLQSKEEVVRIVTESYDYAIESINKMNPETFDESVVRGPFDVSRIGWVRKALEHASHHRGQCAIYLRMNDITPPKYQLF